jgi:hypothetical protein
MNRRPCVNSWGERESPMCIPGWDYPSSTLLSHYPITSFHEYVHIPERNLILQHFLSPCQSCLNTAKRLKKQDKKENKIFLIYKEIQSGAVAKSYMRKSFLIYEEMRKYFPIYEEAVSHV